MKLFQSLFIATFLCGFVQLLSLNASAQFPMPPSVPIWDANKVTLTLQKITENVYAVLPATAQNETTKGIPQATSAGIIIGDKGVLLIETMMTKKLYDQLYKLVRSLTTKPVLYAINTSDHGDHCFGNYLLPEQTIIIQNEFCKENLSKNYESIKDFMVMLFGKGRGIEDTKFRSANFTIAKNQNLKIDMGMGIEVELLNVGTAQSPADLFVFVKTPARKILWAGNPFISERPSIPWLFDGYFLEPAENLNRIYNMLGDEDIVVPGHGRLTNKAGIKYTIDYVQELKKNVSTAIDKGLSLEQTQKLVTMKEYNKGYILFQWLHYSFNIPNAYKDIKGQSAKAASSN